MVIFNSYVSLPEGSEVTIQWLTGAFYAKGMSQGMIQWLSISSSQQQSHPATLRYQDDPMDPSSTIQAVWSQCEWLQNYTPPKSFQGFRTGCIRRLR